MLLLLALFFGFSLAQRPDNASLCDYYAGIHYGQSTNATQAKLIQSIVALAFGGSSSLYNLTSNNLTGILNPGVFQGQQINLGAWFNGTKDSTNLNDAPAGINWLDGGGLLPLDDYLNGKTPQVVMQNNTNQS